MTVEPPSFTREPAPTAEAAPSAPSSLGVVGAVAGRRLRGVLRSIRVDAQDLRLSLTKIQDVVDSGAAQAAIMAAMATEESFRATNTTQVDQRFQLADQLLESYLADPRTLGGDISDELTGMENEWARVVAAWPPVPATAADVDLGRIRGGIADARGYLDALIFAAARLTIPSRLVESLARLRVGGRLDFHQAFADELPSREDRVRLLEYLARYPGSYQGLIDPESGLIFRIAGTTRRRLASYGFMALAVLGGVAIILVLTALAPANQSGWPFTPARLPEFLGAYAALIAGAIAHIAVDSIKQYRSGKGSSQLLALDDLYLWGHVHEMGIIVTIVSLWIILLGLAAFLDQVAMYAAFLAGYSADSVLDIFLARFTTTFSEGASSVLAGLAPASGPSAGGSSGATTGGRG
jgi:hypothetical protein